MRRISIFLALIMIALLPVESNVDAQSDNRIEIGQTVTGDLQSDAGDRWTFSGAAGDIVEIRLDSADFDPALELIAPDGSSLDTDDDGGTGFNAEIRVMLPADGEYTIIARSFRGGSGTYTLSLDDIEPPDRTLTYGDTVEGFLTAASVVENWTFQGIDGDVVKLRLLSSVTPEIVLTFNGETIANVYARELIVGLPGTGEYTIAISIDSLASRGYLLSLERYVDPPVNSRLEYDTNTEFFVRYEDSEGHWIFNGTAGDIIRLVCMVDSIPQDLILTDPQGHAMETLSAYPAFLYRLPATGEYTISIQYNQIHNVMFTLTLDHLTAQPLEAEQVVANRFKRSADLGFLPTVWTFTAATNEVIVAESFGLDSSSMLFLFDDNGIERGHTSSYFPGWSVMAYRVPAAGDYTLIALYRGDILLHRLGERTTDSITYDESTLSYLESDATEDWYFSGEVGDIVSISARSISSPVELVLEDAEGRELHRSSSNVVFQRSSLVYTLPASGRYTISVSHPSHLGAPGVYVLSLGHVESGATSIITSGEAHWTFTAQAEDMVYLHLDVIGRAPGWGLYASDGSSIIPEQWEADAFARIPADGTYIVVARPDHPAMRFDPGYLPARYTLTVEVE